MRNGRGYGSRLLAALTLLASAACDTPTSADPSDTALSPAKAGGLPAAPTVTASPVSSAAIRVTWSDNSTNETGFDIWRSSQAAGPFAPLTTTGPNVTTYVDETPSSGTSSCYTVRSIHTIRGRTSYSAFSAPACTSAGPPPPPLGIVAQAAGSTVIRLYVRDTSPTIPRYRIERGPSAEGPWDAAGTTTLGSRDFVDSGRAPELRVCYRATAFNDAGESAPSPPSCELPLAGPTSLTATVVRHDIIDLSWVDNSSHELGYSVEWSASETGPYSERRLAANSTSFRVTELAPATSYWFRVRATGDSDFSDYSNLTSTSTPARPIPDTPPAPAFGLSSRPDYNSIHVTWADTGSNKQGSRLERRLETEAAWQTLIALGNAVRMHWDYGVPTETSACYRIVSFNESGESASDSTCTAIPESPSLGSITIDRDTVELIWNDASAFEDGYQVWDASACGCRWDATLLAELPANTTSYRIALPAGQYGYYFIQPVKGGGQGPNSMIEEIANTTPP